MNRFVLIVLGIFLLLLTPVKCQTVARSHHPVDPLIDGSFVVDGAISIDITGKYLQNPNYITLLENSYSVVQPSWVWDIVHKPHGNGTYNLYLRLGEIEYKLAALRVDSKFLYVDKLYNGTKVATSQFWPEGSKISHWQVGQYLAVVSPIKNINVPKCASLIIEVGSGVQVDLITIVTQKPDACSNKSICFKTPLELSKIFPYRDRQVYITRNIYPVVYGFDYLKKTIRSNHPVDKYDRYAVAVQLTTAPLTQKDALAIYNTTILLYNNGLNTLPDYTIGQVLSGYINAKPSSSTHTFFGSLLEWVVLSSQSECKK